MPAPGRGPRRPRATAPPPASAAGRGLEGLAAAGAGARPAAPGAHLVASPRYDGQDAAALRPGWRGWRASSASGSSPRPSRSCTTASRRRLVDVLTCIREGRRIDAIGRAALANAERRLRSEAEMLRLFAGHEAAVHRAGEIAEDCRFSARRAALRVSAGDLGRRGPAGAAGAADRRGAALALSRTACPTRRRAQADKELALIARKAYAPFFLTVHDAVVYRPQPGHPLPGPRLGGELDRLLRARRSPRCRPRSAPWSSSASSPTPATSRPTSTSTSSTSGARR